MRNGFPLELLPLFRCTRDAGALEAVDGLGAGADRREGSVRCERCEARYRIVEGILDLLSETGPEDPVSALEMRARDHDSSSCEHPDGLPPWHPPWRDELEVPETLGCLGDVRGCTVLELGCGTGLYTRPLAAMAARIAAVDFSMESLLVNARHAPALARVALARADVAHLRYQPEAFDVAFTTLYSNLPTEDLRAATNRAVHEGLAPGGRYVVSAHHHGIRRRVGRLDRAGVYSEEFPVFYECFTRRSLRRELLEFDAVAVRSAVVLVPGLSRIASIRRGVSSIAGRIPLLRGFGELLVATAVKLGRLDLRGVVRGRN